MNLFLVCSQHEKESNTFLVSSTVPHNMAVVRSSYNACYVVNHQKSRIRLKNIPFLVEDLKIIRHFLSSKHWKPVPLAIWGPEWSLFDVRVESDASTGWGAVVPPLWICGVWPESMKTWHINEL